MQSESVLDEQSQPNVFEKHTAIYLPDYDWS